jgi:hypothetical protein
MLRVRVSVNLNVESHRCPVTVFCHLIAKNNFILPRSNYQTKMYALGLLSLLSGFLSLTSCRDPLRTIDSQ